MIPRLAGTAFTAGSVLACTLLATQPAAAMDESRGVAGELVVPEAAEVCLSCHAFQPGEPHLEGPSLWQVVGRPIAGAPGYDYSEALRKQEGRWDREQLDRFLAAPQEFAPGTLMTLGGVRNAADRQQVLDFLATLAPAADAPAATDAGGAERRD